MTSEFSSALRKMANNNTLPCEYPADMRRAIEIILDAELKINPGDPRLQKLKGFFLFDREEYRDALHYLSSAAQAFSKRDSQHTYYIGICLYKLGRYAEALPHLVKCANKYRGDSDLSFMAGYASFKTGEPEKARSYLKSSLPRLDRESLDEFRAEIAELALNGARKTGLTPDPKQA